MRFEEKVWELTKKIPKGRVSTYKAIGEAMGTKAYRAVGQALHRNPYAPKVPCHRVVASGGHLHGFASGLKKKKQLLADEGIEFEGQKIKRFSELEFRFC